MEDLLFICKMGTNRPLKLEWRPERSRFQIWRRPRQENDGINGYYSNWRDARKTNIVTNQAYDPLIRDLGSEEIIGVYGSVAKANVAARETMKDNLGGSEDEDEDEGSEGESDVDPREEGFDSEGCITLTAAEGRYDQWMCSVNSYKVG